jgi:hypothetical protein
MTVTSVFYVNLVRNSIEKSAFTSRTCFLQIGVLPWFSFPISATYVLLGSISFWHQSFSISAQSLVSTSRSNFPMS